MLDDELITEVARALTAGDPSPALRGRVLARLDDRRRIGHRWTWLATIAATTAVAMVVSSAALWPRRAWAPSGPVAPVLAATSPLDGALASAPLPSAEAARRVKLATPWSGPGLTQTGLPPIDRPTAIALADIQPNPLGISLLNVTPIVLPPIALPPLGDAADSDAAAPAGTS